MITWLKVALVIFTAVLLQVTRRGERCRSPTCAGDIVLLVAIAAGLESDAEQGAIVGFFAGLTFDLLLDTPVGLSALVVQPGRVRGRHVAGLGAARRPGGSPSWSRCWPARSAVLIFALLDEVSGQATVDPARLPAIVGVVAVLNGLLSRPARWAMRHALSDSAMPPTASSSGTVPDLLLLTAASPRMRFGVHRHRDVLAVRARSSRGCGSSR